tara:strand:+ start:928 stop:2445 length:1518 start_codon:yes stop_codon:yes gene_type:complete
MPKTIKITKLKHIKSLTFEIPEPGVHLLAGQNGAGKTSVLACLRRIGHSNAFAQHFAASTRSRTLDNFDGAEIEYTLHRRSVTYAYGGERWVPRPRSNSRLLQDFGYPSVLYIGATADRITPRPEDFNPRRISQVPQEIRDAANQIFGTKKFDNLRKINLTRGSGNSAFVLQASAPPNAKYYSERNFSLGELCILKLIRDLMTCAVRSLLLIDELELALHPKAQIELLKYLTEMSARKELTVIFSTHSVSLLKHVPREKILFLESKNGNIKALKGCFPTYALGNIAYDEERAPDLAIYVEDESALHITDALKTLALKNIFNNEMALFPSIQVIPIGPFDSVVNFLRRSAALLPPNTRAHAILDEDVNSENIRAWRNSDNRERLAEFRRLERQISFLPWTPEVGLIEYFRDYRDIAESRIREATGEHQFSIRDELFGDIPEQKGGQQRSACKASLQRIAAHMSNNLQGMNEDRARRLMFREFSIWYFAENRDEVMRIFGPIINNHA